MSSDQVSTDADERRPLIQERSPPLNTPSSNNNYSGPCICDPSSVCHRLIALFFMCLLGFGSYFCYDNPGALQMELKESMDINTAQFANLYAWYSWPNVVIPIIGGFLMDKVFGIRLGTCIFALFILIGQLVFSLGGFVDKFWVMEAGRFIFGLGGESLSVAQNTYAVSWFKGKELNMVFGFQISIARVGSTVNFLTMGTLYQWLRSDEVEEYTTIGTVLLIAAVYCLVSFMCSLILGYLDKRAERILCKESTETGEVVKLSDIKDFPVTFWLLCLTCISYYVAIFPFVSLAQVYFIKKFQFTAMNASFITGLIYLISAPASPLLGLLIDKTGRNIFWVFISVFLTLASHALLAFTYVNPYVGIVMMGLAYSLLASALWPIAAFIIPEYQLGTAYGLMQAIQNLGLALISMAAGVIVDNYGYLWLEIFFMCWLTVGLLSTIIMFLIDFLGTGYLNMTVGQRTVYEQCQMEIVPSLPRRDSRANELLRQAECDFTIRNRYLSRIGAQVPHHVCAKRLYKGRR